MLVSHDGSSVYYSVTATDASTGVMAAHIHVAPRGSNGPVVVTLCSPQTKRCGTEGVIAEGTFTEAEKA